MRFNKTKNFNSLQERCQGTGECSEKGKEVCEGSKHVL